MAYIEPKTDWEPSDPITPADYNRIKNNLIYVNDLFNEAFEEYIFEPGEDIGIDEWFKASKFNMFEDCVENFQRSGTVITYGERSYYSDNGHLPDYNQLNRLEKCTKDYAELEIEIHVQSISINPQTATIQAGQGDRITVAVNILPVNASNKNYSLTNSGGLDCSISYNQDRTIVYIDVSSIASPGTYPLVFKTNDGNKTATLTVTIEGILIQSISTTAGKSRVEDGELAYFNVTISPSNATNTILSIDNLDNIDASIDFSGTGSSQVLQIDTNTNTNGNYRIKISSTDGSNKSATVTVTVANP